MCEHDCFNMDNTIGCNLVDNTCWFCTRRLKEGQSVQSNIMWSSLGSMISPAVSPLDWSSCRYLGFHQKSKTLIRMIKKLDCTNYLLLTILTTSYKSGSFTEARENIMGFTGKQKTLIIVIKKKK